MGWRVLEDQRLWPYPIWIWLNGHEWAKRQCEKTGIGYTALDNGFRDCADPRSLQRICDRLGPGAVKRFFWRWLRRLPSPFTPADLRAGYVYELAFRQFEVSDTRVFDRPAAGRTFFEQVIRDHLDVGRQPSVALIFDRAVGDRVLPSEFFGKEDRSLAARLAAEKELQGVLRRAMDALPALMRRCRLASGLSEVTPLRELLTESRAPIPSRAARTLREPLPATVMFRSSPHKRSSRGRA